METFYLAHEEFWDWFNRTETFDRIEQFNRSDTIVTRKEPANSRKRMKIEHRQVVTESATRYIILYGRHKPEKKKKVWEGDGYLSLVGQEAHICDLRGRMLEEPTLLDDIDYKLVKDLGELVIGTTEVQVIELDKR